MSPFLSSTGPTASLSSNLASNKTSSVNQLINRSSNCCGRSLIRPVLSAVWVAASPQCLPLVYITIHFVRSCLLYKGGYRGCGGHRTGGWGHPPLRRVTIDFVGAAVLSGPSITGVPPWPPHPSWPAAMPPSPLRGEGYDRFNVVAANTLAFPSSVTAAQSLAALLPYECGVPLAGAAPCHLPPRGRISMFYSTVTLLARLRGLSMSQTRGRVQ